MHGADEYTQLSEGSSLPAEPSRGCPSAPVSPYWWEPPSSHTHTHTQAPLPKSHSGPRCRSNPQLCPTEHTQTPDQHPGIAVPLCLFLLPTQLPYLIPWALHSPVPQSRTPFGGTRNSQDNALWPICLNFICSQSTINFAHPQTPIPDMSYISCMPYLFQTNGIGEGGHVLVHNAGIILPQPRVDPRARNNNSKYFKQPEETG